MAVTLPRPFGFVRVLMLRSLTEISRDTQHRRDRSSPRAVKRPQAPYPAKRHATQQTSTHVDYHIDLIPDPHA